ncbi:MULTISPECIES: DUF1616 domain-containing protein [Haloarcula]|uniref:DUF1616 domain-containing protein n=1 Tax=Haloarcula TaxID=2237 RepID=UPI0023ED96DC|nr:DUF1616 domain-containing protein [Halomicroarcula sp. XH51]
MSGTNVWRRVYTHLRRVPVDIAVVIVLIALTALVVTLSHPATNLLRIALGVSVLLFVPGYTLIAAIFPESELRSSDTPREGTVEVSPLERLVLSIATSLALILFTGLLLNFSPWGIRLHPVVIGLTVLTLLLSCIATFRRFRLPEEERFQVGYTQLTSIEWIENRGPDSTFDSVLNVIVVLSVLTAGVTAQYALTNPNQGDRFTEFYLLSEDADGDLVADDYPTEFRRGQSRSLVIGVENQEYETVDYSVVVELQHVETTGPEPEVMTVSEIGSYNLTLAHSRSWQYRHEVTPRMTGRNLRLQYRLYKNPGTSPSRDEEPYREVHLWINVSTLDGDF